MDNQPYLYKQLKQAERKRSGLIIALAGLQLTRKQQAVYVAQEHGYGVVSTGDFIRECCVEQGMDLNYTNVAKIASSLTTGGEVGLLQQLRARIEVMVKKSRGVVVDSIKSPEGIKYLKENFSTVITVGFLASYDFRLKLSRLRARVDEALSTTEFDERDKREIEMGVAEVVILADYFLLADTVERSREQFRSILSSIETMSTFDMQHEDR